MLKVISSSHGELEAVFNAMLANATRLCEAGYGAMFLREGDAFRTAALHGDLRSAFKDQWQYGTVFRPRPEIPMARAARNREVVHVADLREDEGYRSGDQLAVAAVDVASIRTMLIVPMLKDDELIGTFNIFRTEVRPFTDKQIELVKNFAAQAVIAIENTRLLNELRQRTDDLPNRWSSRPRPRRCSRSSQSSPGELEPVFDAMLESAVRVCDAKFGVLHRLIDGAFHTVAMHNPTAAYADHLRQRGPWVPEPGFPLYRLLQTKQVITSVDQATERVPPPSARLAGARSHIAVPMIKDEEVVGAITIYRTEVRPFTDKQIELVQNFAAQAVIAIENTRLLNELRESLAAADRHRRRAQGHQPLDLRSADGARHAGRIGGAALRGR